jgi:DNA-binding response OmpR family regulator
MFTFIHFPGTNVSRLRDVTTAVCAARQHVRRAWSGKSTGHPGRRGRHLVQGVVEDSLTDGGFEIATASSGENAVELLDGSDGKYRALVTDINLGPGKIDGWDVARHAREIDPNFPVVYMSGKDADDWASKGVPNSIMLAKPFAPAQLVTAVSQLLNTSAPIAAQG